MNDETGVGADMGSVRAAFVAGSDIGVNSVTRNTGVIMAVVVAAAMAAGFVAACYLLPAHIRSLPRDVPTHVGLACFQALTAA